jgi:peptide/nickel transport system substrate-binding protein
MDPAKAKELLQGRWRARRLRNHHQVCPPPAYAPSAAVRIIAAMLAEVGINAKLEPARVSPQWLEQVFKGSDFDATIIKSRRGAGFWISMPATKYYFNYQKPRVQSALQGRFTEASQRGSADGDLVGPASAQAVGPTSPTSSSTRFPKIGVLEQEAEGAFGSTCRSRPTTRRKTYWEE